MASSATWSLPSGGAWIEIPWRLAGAGEDQGRSPQGERGLKYQIDGFAAAVSPGRSPQGERGLKSQSGQEAGQSNDVAPLRGSVD